MRVLVVNAGSSSVKLSLLDDERLITARELDAERARIDADEITTARLKAWPRGKAQQLCVLPGGPRWRVS